jgi:SAM-dependent methyltransferase
MSSLRSLADRLRRTPVHPQWLFGKRRAPDGIDGATGIVLDIGAADRWIELHLSPEACYLALDYPSTSERFYDVRPDVFADASRLPLRNASVDNVLCLEVIEHLRDPSSAFGEIFRTLKPGGQAWISMPFAYPLHNEPYDYQRFTKFGLEREAERAGFDVVGIERSNHAIRAAAIIACLAIAGGASNAGAYARILLLPVAVAAILFINLAAWLVSGVWPDWQNLSTGYHVRLRKPAHAPGETGSTATTTGHGHR